MIVIDDMKYPRGNDRDPTNPFAPRDYPSPIREKDYGKCPKCGLKLAKCMMYFCQNANCPCGLGSRGIL